MRNLISYTNWQALNEGGWATTKTQGTPLTPNVIKLVVDLMNNISSEFNSHLREIGLPSLDIMKPIGSGTWWEDDLVNQPDKLYGDVDYMVAYPTLKLTSGKDREDEIATVKLYNAELLMFLEADKVKGVDMEETRKSSTDTSLKLILEVDIEGKPGYVQVDMVVTHKEYSDWAVFRMTPIKNVKGFVLGNLYSSFGEVLDLSIMARGVRAKFEGEVMKPYSKRKGTEDKTISQDAKTFMNDIAKFFWEQANSGKPYKESGTLSSWKGMNPNNPKFEDLCDGINALADTLSDLDEFGTTIKYRSREQFIQAVINRYVEKMMTTYNSSKFDKAETPAAKAAIEKIRRFIDKYIALSKELLK
jgi:hypothetical protein